MENKKKLITIFQIIILALGVFYIFEARVMFRYYNVTALILQIVYFLSWAFLIYATMRIPRKSLRKWEAILYFVLDIICVGLIVWSVFYVGVTYEDFIDVEDSGLGYMFMMILYGIPYCIATVVLSVISIIKIVFTKTNNKEKENTITAINELEANIQKKKEINNNKEN